MTRLKRIQALGGAIAAATLLLATAALAQPGPGDYTDETTLPAGRRGERIRQVLDAVNSGERARVEALVKDAFGGPFRDIPLSDHLDALLGLYDGSRGVDFYGVRRYTEAEPGGPGGGDREEPPHRGLAGPHHELRRHAGGTDHRDGAAARAAAQGPAPPAAADRRAGQGRARRLPRPAEPRPRPSPAPPFSRRTGRSSSRPRAGSPTATTASRCASTASSTSARWTRCSRRS